MMIKILVIAAALIGLVVLAMSNPQYMKQREFFYGICGVGALLLLALILKLREFPSWYRARGKQVLEPIQLEELLAANPPQIVDLRPREAFVGPKGHIRNAISMPAHELLKRLDELDAKHGRPVVLVDDTDKLSHQGVPLLAAKGHKWIYVLKGGMRAWRREKLPVVIYQERLKH